MPRLDKFLVEQKLCSSRSQAQDHIRSGRVSVNGKTITKTGTDVNDKDLIELKDVHSFVGRGALKAKAAIESFLIETKDIHFLDVGASTGGFTDYLLSMGAKQAVCVDVGSEQLHEKLKNDPRVNYFEQTDIRNFKWNEFEFDLIIVDVSFISLTLLTEQLFNLGHKGTQYVFLIKPQFEAGNDFVNKHGIVDKSFHKNIIDKLQVHFKEIGFSIKSLISSPIKGKNGNEEYLIHLTR